MYIFVIQYSDRRTVWVAKHRHDLDEIMAVAQAAEMTSMKISWALHDGTGWCAQSRHAPFTIDSVNGLCDHFTYVRPPHVKDQNS